MVGKCHPFQATESKLSGSLRHIHTALCCEKGADGEEQLPVPELELRAIYTQRMTHRASGVRISCLARDPALGPLYSVLAAYTCLRQGWTSSACGSRTGRKTDRTTTVQMTSSPSLTFRITSEEGSPSQNIGRLSNTKAKVSEFSRTHLKRMASSFPAQATRTPQHGRMIGFQRPCKRCSVWYGLVCSQQELSCTQRGLQGPWMHAQWAVDGLN